MSRVVIDLTHEQSFHLTPKGRGAEFRLFFPPAVTQIVPKQEEGNLLLQFFLSKPIQNYQVKRLENPDRMIIDFPNTLFRSDLLTPVNVGPVEKVRASQFKQEPLVTRVVIDLAGPAELKDSLSEGNTILTLQAAIATLAQVPESVKPVALLKGKVIVVDPGHGGKDNGATGFSGRYEKHNNLKTALKLAKKLSQAGATVLLTREDDSDTTLKGIVEFANNNGTNLFISVHHNAFHPRIRGTETYWWNENSTELACIIHKHMLEELGFKDRGCVKERFYVVHHTTMPAVLIEPGFLTNPEEERLLLTDEYQERTARAVFDGVIEYLKKRNGS